MAAGAPSGKKYLPTLLEFGPLAGFYIGFKFGGLMMATGLLIGLTLLSLLANYLLYRRLALTPLISAIAAAIFGGLTLLLKDEMYIKMKPTIVYLFFAVVLFGGLMRGKGLLKYILGMAFEMDEAGWRLMSRNYAFFFIGIALLNEWIWRHLTDEQWILFKIGGITVLTVLFSGLQLFLLRNRVRTVHSGEEEPAAGADEGGGA